MKHKKIYSSKFYSSIFVIILGIELEFIKLNYKLFSLGYLSETQITNHFKRKTDTMTLNILINYTLKSAGLTLNNK